MFNKEIDEPLIGDKTSCWKKHWKTILVLFAIIVAITITIVLVVVLTKEEKKEEEEKKIYEIIKNEPDFIKPPIKLNAEFKLVRTKNGMLGLLINDPYTTYSLVELNMPNGSFTLTVPGLSYFSEHMVS